MVDVVVSGEPRTVGDGVVDGQVVTRPFVFYSEVITEDAADSGTPAQSVRVN